MATDPPSGVVAIVQARMSSSRLPGKVLLQLAGKTVLEHVVCRARGFAQQVVVCTSELEVDDVIQSHCDSLGCLCTRGPLDDVFARFRSTLVDPRVLRTPWFARVTGDCPLLSTALASQLVESGSDDVDLLAVRSEDLPRGLAVEIVRRSSFLAIDPTVLDGPQREHVTLCFYEQPDRYVCRYVEVPPALRHPQLRLTLDYAEDYELLQRLMAGAPELSAEEAVGRLLHNPDLAALNRLQKQKPARPEQRPR